MYLWPCIHFHMEIHSQFTRTCTYNYIVNKHDVQILCTQCMQRIESASWQATWPQTNNGWHQSQQWILYGLSDGNQFLLSHILLFLPNLLCWQVLRNWSRRCLAITTHLEFELEVWWVWCLGLWYDSVVIIAIVVKAVGNFRAVEDQTLQATPQCNCCVSCKQDHVMFLKGTGHLR